MSSRANSRSADIRHYCEVMKRYYEARGKTARMLDKTTNSKRNTLRAAQTKSLLASEQRV